MMTNEKMILSLSTPPALALGDKARYTKELIRVGKYVKPSDDLAFEVTPDLLDHWVAQFDLMSSNGVRVPVPLSHADAGNPEMNRGWLVGLERTGNSLFGTIELSDPSLARISDVSIYVPPAFTDGLGNEYKRPITHVALTTRPVVPGLSDFVALSLAEESTMIVEVQAPVITVPTAITEALGLLAEATVEEVVAAIKAKEGGTPSPDNPDGPIEASLDPSMEKLVRLAAENRVMRINGLLAAGRVDGAARTKLISRFADKDKLPLALSQGDDTFDFIVDLLSNNKTLSLGEKTGPQTNLPDPIGREVNPVLDAIQRLNTK